MFLFKGSINVVTDINLANAYRQTCKVVYIGELNSSLPPNFIEFSVLLPPYKALEAEINGDMNAYSQIYLNYLMNNEPCFEAIMTIITAAYAGVNVILFVEEGNNLSHLQFLKHFFNNVFGITLGDKDSMFYINPGFFHVIAAYLYSWIDGIVELEDILTMGIDKFLSIMISNLKPAILEKVARENKLVNYSENDLLEWIRQYYNRLMMLVNGYSKPGTVIIWNEGEDSNADNRK